MLKKLEFNGKVLQIRVGEGRPNPRKYFALRGEVGMPPPDTC